MIGANFKVTYPSIVTVAGPLTCTVNGVAITSCTVSGTTISLVGGFTNTVAIGGSVAIVITSIKNPEI